MITADGGHSSSTARAGEPAPRVSVIIANWNGLAHLADCLDSLAAQTFRDFEVILVTMGSAREARASM